MKIAVIIALQLFTLNHYQAKSNFKLNLSSIFTLGDTNEFKSKEFKEAALI